MSSDNPRREYATKDVANMVDIAPPTVRKYAQALEKAGYLFLKNENGFRIFVDKDIFVLNEMKNISNSKGMQVEKIAEMIVFNQGQAIQHEAEVDIVEITLEETGKSNDIAQYDLLYNKLMSKLSKLDMIDDIVKELQEVKESNKSLTDQMKQQEEYIKQSLERRDRELMQAMRKSLEERKALALQTAAAEEEKKAKGFWARLFGR